MKRLMRARDIRHLVFGNPSVQLGDKTISIKEVSKAIYENEEIRKQLSEHAYEKIKSDAKDAHCDFANYGCYGENDNEEFFAVEVYKFKNVDEDDEFLFIVIAKQFTCEFVGGTTEEDVIIDYSGEILSTSFLGSYTKAMSMNEIKFGEKNVKLIKNIPINTTPEKFYVMYKNNEL